MGGGHPIVGLGRERVGETNEIFNEMSAEWPKYGYKILSSLSRQLKECGLSKAAEVDFEEESLKSIPNPNKPKKASSKAIRSLLRRKK